MTLFSANALYNLREKLFTQFSIIMLFKTGMLCLLTFERQKLPKDYLVFRVTYKMGQIMILMVARLGGPTIKKAMNWYEKLDITTWAILFLLTTLLGHGG